MTRAVIYARYSAGPRQTDQSIEGQVADCTRYAEAHGLTVVDVYADHHVSGKSTDGRDDFLRMIDDAAKGLFEVVIVWKVDRFGRDRRDIAIYKHALKKAGVSLVYAAESVPDGPEGILLESLLEGLAEYYSADLRQKVVRGIRESAKKGRWSVGRLPFGYTKDEDGRPVPDPELAPVVRRIYSDYAAGVPAAEIVRDLTKQGVKMNQSTIYRILRNERYLGRWVLLDVVLDVEPLVTEEVFDAVKEKFKTSRNGSASAKVRYVLSGKCICSRCGRVMQGASAHGRSGVYYYYRCPGRKDGSCDFPQLKAPELEDLVLNSTRDVMLTDDMIDALVVRMMDIQQTDTERSELPRMEKALADVERRKKNILKAIESGAYAPELNDRMQELSEEADGLRLEIERAKIKKPLVPEEFLRQWLLSFRDGSVLDDDFAERMAQTFITSVTCFVDHVVVVFNATGTDGSNVSTSLHTVDCPRLRSNRPVVLWPYIVLRLDR